MRLEPVRGSRGRGHQLREVVAQPCGVPGAVLQVVSEEDLAEHMAVLRTPWGHLRREFVYAHIEEARCGAAKKEGRADPCCLCSDTADERDVDLGRRVQH